MKAKLVKVGNSRGIRIPKPICEQCGLEGEIEMDVRDGEIVIRPAHRPRHGWDEAFATMAGRGDDRPLVAESSTEWDAEEWEW